MQYASTLLRVVMMSSVVCSVYSMEGDKIYAPAARSDPFADLAVILEELEEIAEDQGPMSSEDSYIDAQPLSAKYIERQWYNFIPSVLHAADRDHLCEYNVLKLTPQVHIKYPLHKAVALGEIDVVEKLLGLGMNPVAYNDQGLRPLHMVERIENETIALFISGMIIRRVGKDAKLITSFLDAVIQHNVSVALKHHTAGAHQRMGYYVSHMQPFYKLSIALEQCEAHERLKQEAEKAQQLKPYFESLRAVNMPTRGEDMPLAQALKARKYKWVRQLLQYNADVNHERESQRPLVIAVEQNNLLMGQLLRNKGASIEWPVNQEQ